MQSEAREYPRVLELNLNDILDLMGAQRTIYQNSFEKDVNSKDLANRLGGFGTAFGILFSALGGAVGTITGWATAIVGVITEMAFDTKGTLERYVKNGTFYMSGLVDFMRRNPEYDRIRVEVPMIEYHNVDGYVRFIIGEGIITGVHYRGGDWVTEQ